MGSCMYSTQVRAHTGKCIFTSVLSVDQGNICEYSHIYAGRVVNCNSEPLSGWR